MLREWILPCLAFAAGASPARAQLVLADNTGLEGRKVRIDYLERLYGYQIRRPPAASDFSALLKAASPTPPPSGEAADIVPIRVKFQVYSGEGQIDLPVAQVSAVTHTGASQPGVSCRRADVASIEVQSGFGDACFELPRGTRLQQLNLGPLRLPIADHEPGAYDRCSLTLRSAGLHRSVREPPWMGTTTVLTPPEGKLIYEVVFDLVRAAGRPLDDFKLFDAELVTANQLHIPQAGTGPGGGLLAGSRFSRSSRKGTLRVRFLVNQEVEPATIWVGPSSFDLTALPPPKLAPSPSAAKPK